MFNVNSDVGVLAALQHHAWSAEVERAVKDILAERMAIAEQRCYIDRHGMRLSFFSRVFLIFNAICNTALRSVGNEIKMEAAAQAVDVVGVILNAICNNALRFVYK